MGELHVIVGCMFSSKTTTLEATVRSILAFADVLVLTHSLDTRYTLEGLASHDGSVTKAHRLDRLSNIIDTNIVTPELVDIREKYNAYKYIAVDEAQFFDHTDLMAFLETAMRGKKIIHIAGLDSTSEGKAFLPFNRLIPLCTTIGKRNAYCKRCGDGTKAAYSKAIIPKVEAKKVGGKQDYEAVCYEHWLEA